MNEMKFAVLIDGDNVAPKYLKAILDEVADNGVATYKRVYTDWTSLARQGWKKVMLEHSVMPVQQYSYTTGKNATDSAMIIDAMDILYTGNVDGFYLCTSDSDFTRLAARLREAGKFVVGVGEAKTPSAFRSACNSFKLLEVISGSDDTSDDEPTQKNTGKNKKKEYALTPIKEIKSSIYKIIDELLGLGASVFRLPVTRDTDYDSFWYSAEAVMNKIDSFVTIVFVVFFLVMAVISLFGVAVNTPDIPDLSNIGQAQAKPQAAQPVPPAAPVQNPAPQAAQAQPAAGKTCPKCGAPVSDGTAFCTKCGNKIG